MKSIGLLLISTNKYSQFVQPLIDSVNEYFFKDQEVTVYLFTDKILNIKSGRIGIEQYIIEPYKFPFATLYRYKIFSEHTLNIKTDYVFYSDVDMKFVAPIGEEILPGERHLTVVQHPGYCSGGWGDMETHPLSEAFLHTSKRRDYYCGGFQGGTREAYLNMSIVLSGNIEKDLRKAREINFKDNHGVLARWHDESHYNHYIKTYQKPNVLSPSYCFPENWNLPFEPKIIALEKDHNEVRA